MDIDKIVTEAEAWRGAYYSHPHTLSVAGAAAHIRSLLDAVRELRKDAWMIAEWEEINKARIDALLKMFDEKIKREEAVAQLAAKDKEIAELKRKFLDTEVRS